MVLVLNTIRPPGRYIGRIPTSAATASSRAKWCPRPAINSTVRSCRRHLEHPTIRRRRSTSTRDATGLDTSRPQSNFGLDRITIDRGRLIWMSRTSIALEAKTRLSNSMVVDFSLTTVLIRLQFSSDRTQFRKLIVAIITMAELLVSPVVVKRRRV